MSWAGERLAWLNQRYSYGTIREYTGIPESTISYVIKGERLLPGQYSHNLALYFNREAYRALRAAGATTTVARQYRGHSVASIQAYLDSSNNLVNQLVQYRFDQYKASLIKSGRFISDADVLQRLASSIAANMGKSARRDDKNFAEGSPNLRHFVVVDDE